MKSKKEIYKELSEKIKKEYNVDDSAYDFEKFSKIVSEKSKKMLANLDKNNVFVKKWLTELQNKNPFIGKKYISRAEEYETDYKILSSDEINLSELDESILDQIIESDKKYDKNSVIGGFVEKRNDIRYTYDMENKFIDYCITVNTVKNFLTHNKNDLKKIVIKNIKDYHENENYETKINLNCVVDYVKTKLLTNDIKKLTND